MNARWSWGVGALLAGPVFGLSLACSQAPGAPPPTSAEDPQADAAADASDAADAAPVGPYPAFQPDIGLLTSFGGPILASPELVTVTWAADPLGPLLADFDEKLGPSPYWSLLNEYGVVSTTSSPDHVVVPTAAPSTWEVTDLESWMVTQIEDPTSGWPTPGPRTLYVVYTPPGAEITSGGSDICAMETATHYVLTVGESTVPYVIVFGSCMWSATIQDSETVGGAITIAGAATDPEGTAYDSYDNAHYAWELFTKGVGDVGLLCADYLNDYFRPGPSLPYAVGRLWSNKSATAGHDPCVPAEPGAYYNATPLGMDLLEMSVGAPGVPVSRVQAKGYRIAPGASATFQIGLYSDAPTTAWSVQAVEGDGMNAAGSPVLDISTDESLGNNGDRIDVTVHVKAAPADGETGVLMTVLSTQNQVQHFLPILIGTY